MSASVILLASRGCARCDLPGEWCLILSVAAIVIVVAVAVGLWIKDRRG